MDKQQINQICRQKIEEILDKNFGLIAQYETLEHLDEMYPKDKPEKLFEEFKAFLQSLLDEIKPNSGTNLDDYLNSHVFSVLSAQKFKDNIELYHTKAHEITLFEKLTDTNKNDVTNYKFALYKYTETVLHAMKEDFVYDLV